MITKPVFIVGLNRTGSTLVKNMLDLNSEIAMVPEELHLWDPYPWANVVLNNCKKLDFQDKKNIVDFVEDLFSKKFYGSFWQNINNYDIDKNKILTDLQMTDENRVNCKEIINLIFLNYLWKQKKKRIGVKYPIHISKISLLNQWYPDCKIIHLTRDPRAIYSSKSNDEFTKKLRNKYKKIEKIILIVTLIRTIFEYNWSRRIHIKHRKDENYMLLRYEDLISEPEKNIKKLCSFLEISFEQDMLFPSGKPSSHTNDRITGFDKNRIDVWKTKIHNWEIGLIDFFAKKSLDEFNYN